MIRIVRFSLLSCLVIGAVFATVLLIALIDITTAERQGNSVQKARISVPGAPHLTLSYEGVNARQKTVLEFAYRLAKVDGYARPEVLPAILMQESHACSYPKGFRVVGHKAGLGPLRRSYGCGQLKLEAALDVLKRYPDLHQWSEKGFFETEEELIAQLILNDEFNIRVASKYFRLTVHEDESLERRITAYNLGPSGAYRVDVKRWPYTLAVSRHMRKLLTRAVLFETSFPRQGHIAELPPKLQLKNIRNP